MHAIYAKIGCWFGWETIAHIEVYFSKQGVINGNCRMYICMIIKYLFIFCLLQTNPQQLVSMNFYEKHFDESKRKSQIIDVVNYYLENLLCVLK